MTPLAVVVLAHADPAQVRRLIRALDGLPVFLHCDARTHPAVFRQMTRDLPGNVQLTPRVRTTLASWSLVRAEVAAVRAAVERTDAGHIAVLSGADYPLMPVADLIRELQPWQGRSWITNLALPMSDWDTRRHPDGGLWRLRYRYLTRRDQVIFIGGHPLRTPWRRTIPAELSLRASPHWKIYARHHAELLLRLVEERSDLVRFWRSTLVPEESFVASVLSSPRICGPDALPLCTSSAWHIDWRSPTPGHPRWLGDADLEALRRARWAEPVRPDQPVSCPSTPVEDRRKLFARKFRSAEPGIVQRIDAELRTPAAADRPATG